MRISYWSSDVCSSDLNLDDSGKVSALIFGKVFDVATAVEIDLFLIASERDGAGGVDPKNCGQRNVGHVLLFLPRMKTKARTGHRLLPSGKQSRGMPQVRDDTGGGESPVMHVAKR